MHAGLAFASLPARKGTNRKITRRIIVSRRAYGVLAGVIGIGAWWWSRHRSISSTLRRDRGTVIFDNTPTFPADGDVM
jgi:hypothetical protein